MTRQKTIQVFEYESLTLHENRQGHFLTKHQLAKLYEFNDRNKNKYFTGIRNGVKFKSYVGVIQIGGLTIEILPKADRKADPAEQDYMHWHGALLDMLNYCRKIQVNSVSEAALDKRYNNILDLYFQLFLDELRHLLRRGLIKQYRKQTGNLHVVKGRILFAEQIKKNLVHQHRTVTEHQVYDTDHLYNQILFRALAILDLITTNPSIKDQIHRIRMDFPNVQNIPITHGHFSRLKVTRKTRVYDNALQIARMIILNFAPDIRTGNEHMLALLFNMNILWEEYIFRVLQRHNQDQYEVNFQNSEDFWEKKTIRPDIVLAHKQDNEKKYIIDTKWKIIESNDPSDQDLKQMFAYNIYWDTGKSLLLYPGSESREEAFGNFHKGRATGNQCKVGFIHVLDENGKLDKTIGGKIIEKLEKDNSYT